MTQPRTAADRGLRIAHQLSQDPARGYRSITTVIRAAGIGGIAIGITLCYAAEILGDLLTAGVR